MAVTITNAAAAAACNAVVDLLDAGSAVTYPFLEFKTVAGTSTAGNGEVAHLDFTDATAFGSATTASPAVATAGTIADDTTAAGGTTTKFYLYDQDNTDILTGSVTATSGGGDIELSSVAIGVGDTVSMSGGLTVSMPTS